MGLLYRLKIFLSSFLSGAGVRSYSLQTPPPYPICVLLSRHRRNRSPWIQESRQKADFTLATSTTMELVDMHSTDLVPDVPDSSGHPQALIERDLTVGVLALAPLLSKTRTRDSKHQPFQTKALEPEADHLPSCHIQDFPDLKLFKYFHDSLPPRCFERGKPLPLPFLEKEKARVNKKSRFYAGSACIY